MTLNVKAPRNYVKYKNNDKKEKTKFQPNEIHTKKMATKMRSEGFKPTYNSGIQILSIQNKFIEQKRKTKSLRLLYLKVQCNNNG